VRAVLDTAAGGGEDCARAPAGGPAIGGAVTRQGRVSGWMRLGIVLLKPPCVLLTRRVWRGRDQVPSGGVILAANHISHVDPIVLCDFVLYYLRRAPRFLAKAELFRGNGLVARVMRGAGQIPVQRNAASAAQALDAAVAALHRAETVVIYPEGTVSREPDKWPMVARTGVARLALLSGAPVVPVAQWGAQEILDSYRRPGLRLLPRRAVHICADPPVDLSAFVGTEPTSEVLRDATEAVMAAITAELEGLRNARAPQVRYDVRVSQPAADADEQRRSA
jgi:1-acyl-sn-glycerol-3-phosphate acyltransferase